MEDEKRMVGDYTVLCAVNIGAREIILARMSRVPTENASSAATESATTYLKSLPSVLLVTTTLMQRCSLQSASSKTPRGFGQRLKSWIFP